MSSAPFYSFHRHPQFSVNHISEYLATTNASQRAKVISAAKFPKRIEVAAYTQVRPALRSALTSSDFGHEDLSFLLERMEAKQRQETGYQRDEALRCARAIQAFQGTFSPRSFSRYQISAAPRQLSRNIEGVRVNVTLDATVTEGERDSIFAGGIVLVYAFASDRGSIRERLATTAGLMLWALEDRQMEPLPRLCMAVDLAEREIVRASASHTRFRARVADTCHEIAARWSSIEPPSDYDGPDWR